MSKHIEQQRHFVEWLYEQYEDILKEEYRISLKKNAMLAKAVEEGEYLQQLIQEGNNVDSNT